MQNDALLLASWKNCRKEAAAMQITNVKNEFYFFVKPRHRRQVPHRRKFLKMFSHSDLKGNNHGNRLFFLN